ncbi:putative neutral sphingomyelinase isoform X2 [Acanthaster planci]|uniref:sphingomyelin phosphodiesterase n=1 Tax=Acanthaster planci TaxID=133434 RepID=A0A8B7ZMS3_ACAPL|nr:putative neutral sphingomyelinase isoform X2 [Acanthaster planci]
MEGGKEADPCCDVELLIWMEKDYKQICDKAKDVLPYHHYFHSGFLGSGMCILSKWPIVDTLFHGYSLNSYAYRILEGDWFGGKGVGLCVIQVDDFTVNVYTTHNTAMYAPSNVFSADEHFTHRLLQGYELSKFVRFTGTNSDLNVVTGDFNTEDNSLGLKVARVNADLQDAWLDRPNQCKDEPCCTVEAPDNCYTSTKTRFYPQHPGMRIDYILYNAKPRSCCVTCRDCRLTFKKIPGTDINYSDHDGVEALFELEKGRDDQVLEPSDEEGRLGVLLEMLPYLSDSIQKITRQRFCYLLVSLLFFLLLASLWLSGAFHWQTSVYARCGALVALLALVVLGLAALCIGVSVKTTELNQLIGRKREITLNVRRLESQLKNK